MKLKIKLTGIASELASADTIDIEISDQKQLPELIKKYIPGLGNYKFVISVNGTISDLATTLKSGDKVLVFSPFSGG